MAYGYIGDKTSDRNSLLGIGNSNQTLKPGSLKPYESAAMTPAGAIKRGLHPTTDGRASGEPFEYKGKTYVWDDTPSAGTPDDYVDVYEPNRAPDPGVSQKEIARQAGIAAERPGSGNFLPPPPSAEYVRPHTPPPEAEDLGPQGQTGDITQQLTAVQKPPTPTGAAVASPLSQQDIDDQQAAANQDPEVLKEQDEAKQKAMGYSVATDNILKAHSAALPPGDQRVALRTNPDTGSERIVGAYFVPQDPVHQQLLSGLDPIHHSKFPELTTAINRAAPYSFMYDSAPTENEGSPVTGESRQFEQKQSTADQRFSEGAPVQTQRATIIPQQLVATNPDVNNASKILMEGFGADQVMNNAQHLFNGAQQAKVPVPYSGMNDFNFQKDLAGYLQNQAHGLRGDGSGPTLDETGQPNRLYQTDQAKPNPYIAHQLQKPHAQFIHAALNIIPSKRKNAPGKAPSFGERAQWLRRVNEAHTGQVFGVNDLMQKLDQKLPQVGMRNKKGDITRHVPWSKGTLEPTWRAYRVEGIHHEMPPIESRSLRDTANESHLVHRAPQYRHAAAEFKPHEPAPISEDPAIGSYTDKPGEKITHAAVRDRTSGKTYLGYNHQHAYDNGRAQDPRFSGWVPEEDEGFWTNKGRFLSREEGWNFAKKSNQLVNAGDEPVLHAEQVQGRKLDTWDMPHGSLGAAPISGDPEVGAPAGAGAALAADESDQGDIPEGSHPEQTTEFGSPAIRENMTLNTARRALKSPQHAASLDFHQRLEKAAGQKQSVRSAIGSWKDGNENSFITQTEGQDYAQRRLAQAIKGLHGAQKQVALFQHHDEGPHSLFSLTFHSDKPEEVANLLAENGIDYRTLETPEKGQRLTAHVIDTDGSALPGIENLIKNGHVHEAYHQPGTAEFIGDPNGESREEGARNYRAILQEARNQAGQGQEGDYGVQQPDAWWEPYAHEAEKHFQDLRDTDEYENQAKALDYKASKADRDILPADQEAELQRLHQIGKKWTAEHPDLDPRTDFAYTLGKEHFPRDDMSKRDIGEYFDRIHRKLDFSKPAHQEEAANVLFQDIMHSLAGSATGKPSDAYGWYDRSVRKTINKFGEVAPKILTDPEHELAFKLGLAITSQGQDVDANAESAWHVYQYWQRHGGKPGDLPTSSEAFGGGTKARAMEHNFAKINELWKKHGTEGMREILEEPISVGKLKKDHELTVSGEKVNHVVRGAMGMGPKVGAFFSNLIGNFDPVTMDMWWSRDLNKVAGDMFNFSEHSTKVGSKKDEAHLTALKRLLDQPEALSSAGPEQIARMKNEVSKLDAVPEGKLTRTKALRLAPSVYDWAEGATKKYARSYGPGQRSWHPDFATDENVVAKKIHENVANLSDAPRGAEERDQWRQITGLVNNKLNKLDIHLTNADKQALGWFNIKDLFRLAGSTSRRNADYLDAAYTLTRRIKNGQMTQLGE